MSRTRDAARPLSRWRRAAAALSLFLHVAVAAGAPLADARAESAARGAYDHVESRREHACTPGHDHLLCQFCRVHRTGGAPPPAAASVAAIAPGAERAERVPADPHFPSAPVSSLGSRAPPAA